METNLLRDFPPKAGSVKPICGGLICQPHAWIAPLLCGFDLHMSRAYLALWDGKRALGPSMSSSVQLRACK